MLKFLMLACVVGVLALAACGLEDVQIVGEDVIEKEEKEEKEEFEVIEEIEEEPVVAEPEPFVPVFTREPLPDDIVALITGLSFRDYAPFELDFLTFLTVTHVNFEGEYKIGHMIVADEIGDEVLEIFQEIFKSRFPIHSIKLIDHFDADDYRSLEANNTSAFNFRYIAGTSVLSRHAFGMAIDINPIQNPFYRDGTIQPYIGRAYLDREYIRPGMIVPGGPVYEAFISRGWIWGGNWAVPRDYHHFEKRN